MISDHNNRAIQAAQSESDAFTLLALQAPVATDLRAVVSSLRSVADVDRMRALALHVAKTARRRHPAHAIPDDVSDYFAEMGRIAPNIGYDAKDVVRNRPDGQPLVVAPPQHLAQYVLAAHGPIVDPQQTPIPDLSQRVPPVPRPFAPALIRDFARVCCEMPWAAVEAVIEASLSRRSAAAATLRKAGRLRLPFASERGLQPE